jgi:TPR repeat protein
MAAEQNYAKAQFCLGWCYREGRGVAKDEMEAVKWWHKAAEQNNADAQFILGHCYAKGQCVAKDYVEAVKWFRKAAEPGRADYLIRGHTFAQLSLGRCYEHGQGVPQDVIEAYKFYKLFADDEVCHDPSDSLKRIVTRMSAVEIAEGERRYREFRLQKI